LARVVVTGGAGFVGSALCESLLRDGHEVVCFDLFVHGDARIRSLRGSPAFHVQPGDVRRPGEVLAALRGAEGVFHLAADPEVRTAADDAVGHVTANAVATLYVAEAARTHDLDEIAFASSSTVYGEAATIPTPETAPLAPIGLYGAGKMASEAILGGYCHAYGLRGASFRFANVVGPGLSHGVIYDFVAKLRANPAELEVLGDGTQRKSYVDLHDCVAGMRAGLAATRGYEAWNLGTDDWTTVRDIAEIVCAEMGAKDAVLRYAGGPDGRGWKGDVKTMRLDSSKLQATGWRATKTSRQAVENAARSLVASLRR